MPPPTNALDRLAPDQRAAVELVLRQGRSYGELANVLGLPEDTIRARTRGGLEALAPDLPPPPRAGEIADWLLGQQAPAHAARTRALVAAEPGTRHWAETVPAPPRALSDDITSLAADLPAPRDGAGTRPRPLRDGAANGEPATPAGRPPAQSAAAPGPPPHAEAAAAPAGRSSRLGGAILIALAALVIGGVIAFV